MTALERDTQFIMETTNVTKEEAEKIARALWVRHKHMMVKPQQTKAKRAKRTKGLFSHIEDNIIIDAFWYKVKVGLTVTAVCILIELLVLGGLML